MIAIFLTGQSPEQHFSSSNQSLLGYEGCATLAALLIMNNQGLDFLHDWLLQCQQQ